MVGARWASRYSPWTLCVLGLAACTSAGSNSGQWSGAASAMGAQPASAGGAYGGPAPVYSGPREVIGGAPGQGSGVPNVVTPGGGMATRDGGDAEHPVPRCGPRDSYLYVSTEFRCADGSNPLGGNLALGARSRSGNVGANHTGHIIDRYVVPCPEGPHEVFVDMYGCPGGQPPPGSGGGGGGIRRVAPPTTI